MTSEFDTQAPDLLATETTQQSAAKSPQFINLYDGKTTRQNVQSPASELAQSISAAAASASPKYFYNALGSKLFEAITQLDEYYPTRTEAAIFQANHSQIAQAISQAGISQPCLIDLGAGNCAKAATLIPHILPHQYVPIDISTDFLEDAAEQLQQNFPALDIIGLGMDFSSQLELPPQVQTHDRVFFYPGSSLGNFEPAQALDFLSLIANPAQGKARGLLIGIDLVKDSATLEAAYDDALGVTGAFNKNLLLNANSLMASDFNLRQWQHVALFNREQSRIEMHLETKQDLTVSWPGQQRDFKSGERMLTEYSYKYTLESMTELLRQAGFKNIKHWTDTQQWFAVFWAEV